MKFTKEHIEGFVKHINYIAGVLEDSGKKSYIKKDIDFLRAVYIIAAMMNVFIFYWMRNNKQNVSLSGQADFMYNMALNGIGK